MYRVFFPGTITFVTNKRLLVPSLLFLKEQRNPKCNFDYKSNNTFIAKVTNVFIEKRRQIFQNIHLSIRKDFYRDPVETFELWEVNFFKNPNIPLALVICKQKNRFTMGKQCA